VVGREAEEVESMADAGYRWMMTPPKVPMIRAPFDPAPRAGEAVVKIYPAALDLVLDSKVNVNSFVEPHPLADINQVFEAVHHRQIKRRAVLIP
jgi:D-arabinose 1-dehydrogenase-like Zn-dependent alcohol dehydrogenase